MTDGYEIVEEAPGVRLVREMVWKVEKADATGVWESMPYADEDDARHAFETARP